MQDIAVPLLANRLGGRYAELIEFRQGGTLRLSELEAEMLPWTHAQVAGMMARRWNLPERFAALIEGHAAIEPWMSSRDSEPGRLVVAMSSLLPAIADGAWPELPKFEECYQQVRPLGGPRLSALLAKIDRDFGSYAPALKLRMPRKSLADCYQESAAAAV